jgi:peptidoglycan L-alanyl-D-glutamate endopeptidase CwlK
MPNFSKRSLTNLDECHADLQKVAYECIKVYDFTIVEGYRGRVEQDLAFREGFSKARFGQSPHNFKPSYAFDAYTYPIDVHDWRAANRLGEAMLAAAARVNVDLMWGGHFMRFKDRPHFELRNWRVLEQARKLDDQKPKGSS